MPRESHSNQRPVKRDIVGLGLANLGFGLGLRNSHFKQVLSTQPKVDWFEVISENFIDDGGWARHVLNQVSEQYPIVLHGVSMSIGNTDQLNFDYLQKLKNLAAEVKPAWVSDHLCWTGMGGHTTHDLLPMPFTQESLDHLTKRVLTVQDFLERPLILENPSSYLEFNASDIDEWEFLSELHKASSCGILLDVNNVYVSSRNHGFDPYQYITALPQESVVQIHIAGHDDHGNYLIDTHDRPVCKEVWNLYHKAIEHFGLTSTLLEWDADIPCFDDLLSELEKAKVIANNGLTDLEITTRNTPSQAGIGQPLSFLFGEEAL